MTNKQRIIKHLITHKNGITSLEAFERYGVTRLSGIIYDLRNRDHMNITTSIIKKKNRYGDDCYIAQYQLGD